MPYYDPSGWIATDDQLIKDVEDKLRLRKQAQSRHSSSGKSFLPPFTLELDILSIDSSETFLLKESIDTKGQININLTSETNTFRKGHFNHMWHHNPDGRDVPPPHHVHFPTAKYPNLERTPTYAHTIIAENDDYLSALKSFCNHVNINIHNISLPLLHRR